MATRRPRSHARDEHAAIDLTPMLDVVFILLIFFVATASFVRETGVQVSRPPAVTREDAGRADILFTVTAANEIWLGERRIDIRSIRENVERLLAVNPRAAVIIRAYADSDTEVFTGIADQARQAGVYDVSLATFAR